MPAQETGLDFVNWFKMRDRSILGAREEARLERRLVDGRLATVIADATGERLLVQLSLIVLSYIPFNMWVNEISDPIGADAKKCAS